MWGWWLVRVSEPLDAAELAWLALARECSGCERPEAGRHASCLAACLCAWAEVGGTCRGGM